MFDQFFAQWRGQRVADPSLAGQLPPEKWYQCVSLIKKYLQQCFGIIASYWGDADKYWTVHHDEIEAKFNYIETKDVEKGDITVLTGNTPRGHIGIATGNQNPTQFEMLEQNGSTGNGTGLEGDAIRTRWISKSRIKGVLRPTIAPPPAPPAPKYSVIETYPLGKQIILNKQPTNLWGMNFDFDYMKDHPVEVHNQGEVWVVSNKVHHINGYDYYRRADQVDGFNVLDCDDYTPPPPPPYIPPSAPVKGNPAEKYELLTHLPYYATAEGAMNGKNNSLGTLPAATYFVISKSNRAYNISSDNMKDLQHWVNTLDNKAPVVVPVSVKTPVRDDTWKSTRSFFYPDRNRYDDYELQMDVVVQDLDNKGRSFFISAYKPNSSDNAVLKVYGTVFKNGVKYYLLHNTDDVDWDYWYVVPLVNSHTGKPYLLKYSETYDTTPKPHDVTLSEQTAEAFARLGYQVWDVVRKLPIIRNIGK